MSTLEERLEDEEYKLWVKAGVCIAAVKNGLAEFARTRGQRAHTHVKTALNNNTSVNNLCPHANIQFDRRLKIWSLGCCHDCQVYVDELENLKIPPFTFKQSNWNNTDIKKWPNEPWEMMKVFMNPGQTAAQKNPIESDLSAILNFITHCRIPRVDIYDQNNISTVRKARNETMHSAQMKISLGDFQKYTKAMIDLLEDQIFLYQLQDAKDAVKIIKEVQAASFCITRSDEVKALNEKTTAILERSSTLTAEIDELRSEQENIRSSVNSGIKHLEDLVKNETDDRQEALDNMTKEMESKEKALKKLSVEISFVNMRINKDKALYRKMYIRMKTVEKTLRKTDKEFQGIKREHSDMKNDLAEIKCRLQMKNGSDLKSDSTKEYQILKQVSKEQEHKIQELHSELKENQIRHEEDTRKLRIRITELEQQNEIYSRCKQANASNQEVKEDKDLVNKLRCENKDLVLANKKLTEKLERLKESTVQETQTKLKEATEMNDALQFENSKLTDKCEKLKSEAKKYPAFAELQEYENENLQRESEIDRLRLELRESDRELKETENMLQKYYSDINKLEYNLQRETEKADIIKKDKLVTEEALRCLTKDSAMILSETVKSLADFQNKIRHTFHYEKNGSEHHENADEEIQTLIQSLFSTKRTLFGDTLLDTNAVKLKRLIIQKISDLQQNFDQEHQLRNTAENDKKASQKTHEDLSKKIEELQKQVQTEKSSREAFEDQHKLSAAAASETSKKCISDLQQKFDQEHKLRNAAENDLKASQETNEDLPKRIEELQKQVQTGKSSRKALEDQHKLSAAAASETSEKCISDMKVVSSSIVDVRLKNDEDRPWITGCVFLSTGQLVLCDCNNKKIKLLSSDLKVEDSLDLQEGKPWDISAASSSAVVITLPRQRQLQFIQLAPKLGQGQLIELDEECWGVCVVGEEIYVTCGSSGLRDSGGEVRIYNTEGVVKRRLGAPTEPDSSYMFMWPQYLTVSACSGRIYVSDSDRRTLTCLSEDGRIIYQYSDPELSYPLGLYVDADDYVIVCGYHSHNLLMISPSGEKVSTLLSEKDGIKYPHSVAYRPSDGTLVIGCGGDNNLHVFKLSR